MQWLKDKIMHVPSQYGSMLWDSTWVELWDELITMCFAITSNIPKTTPQPWCLPVICTGPHCLHDMSPPPGGITCKNNLAFRVYASDNQSHTFLPSTTGSCLEYHMNIVHWSHSMFIFMLYHVMLMLLMCAALDPGNMFWKSQCCNC